MYQLKGAVFSLRDVLVVRGTIGNDILDETVNLLRFILSKQIQPIIVSNSSWQFVEQNKSAQQVLSEMVGQEIPYYQGGKDMPAKQTAKAMQHVLDKHGWKPQEVIYIGSTKEDMQAANNGSLLFLNANWHAKNSPYGFEFDSPKDVARFIDCCCLGIGDWFWALESGPLRVYAIAPLAEYSKRYPGAAKYSADAKQAAKFDRGDFIYWGRLMAARIYFSGLGQEADYVAPYPGHKPDSKKPLLTNALRIVGGSLKAQYLDDLIVRHTQAQKSSSARNQGIVLDHINQLNTIRLRKDPIRTGPKQMRYVNSPLKKDKTVMVVDDICTQGYSIESARAFIETTGANVISVCWLKTPGPNHYEQIESLDPGIDNPYKPYEAKAVKSKIHSNDAGIRNAGAPDEIAVVFARYRAWDWP